MKFMTLRLLLLIALSAVMTGSYAVRAARVDPDLACDFAAAAASEASGVPIDILLAITRVETGRGGADGEARPWPWTINADGAGTWYDTQEEAVEAAGTHLTDGTGTFDVGCFQLNIRWHGDSFDNLSEMFDPDRNAAYAAEFLSNLYQESGNWADAVAAYHSRTPELADSYLQKVKAVLGGPSAPETPTGEYTELPVIRENLFPLLQAGAQGGAGSLVPMQSARGPLIGG